MEIRAKTVGDFSASSSSGDVRAEIGTVKRAAVSTTSGKVDVDFDKFDALTVSATSGNVKADLPEKPGFTATLKVTSGDIRCDLPLTKNGKTYVCGSGSSEVSISTTSGDIEIR